VKLHTVQNLRAAFGVGHEIRWPAQLRAPVVFASPHSGAIYPRAFRRASVLALSDLRRNEDAYVDQLFASVPSLGAPLLRAQFPRCFVDVNRASDDVPPEWAGSRSTQGAEQPSSAYRARLGLGVVPTVIGENMPIFRRMPNAVAVQARIEALYQPYHAALSGLIAQACESFGRALLIDCHSMPGFAPARRAGARKSDREVRRPDIILGDGHGRTAHARTMDMIQALFERAGYEVARNHPYAGGFATLHYGRPEAGVEAVQIEINRDLYLERGAGEPRLSPGFRELSRDLAEIAEGIVEFCTPETLSEAAE
jgi:N-formylglutamate amidohydrolase